MTQAMTQALTTIEQAVCRIEAKSRNASRGVRIALGFGIDRGGLWRDRGRRVARNGRGCFRLSRGPALRQVMKPRDLPYPAIRCATFLR